MKGEKSDHFVHFSEIIGYGRETTLKNC